MGRMLSGQRLTRRQVAFGAAAVAAGLVASGCTSAMLLQRDHAPSLTLLGSGRGMSALIRSGGARVLFLQGSDPADFGNALARGLVPLLHRIDLVIVADQNTGSTFAHASLGQMEFEQLTVIGNTRPLLDAGIAVRESIVEKTVIQLPGSIILTIAPDVATDTQALAWTAEITQESRSILVSFGNPDYANRELQSPISAWTHLSDSLPDSASIKLLAPDSMYVPASAGSGTELKALFPDSSNWRPTRHRIHAGEAMRINFDELG